MIVPLFDTYTLQPFDKEKDVDALVLNMNDKRVTDNIRVPFGESYTKDDAMSFFKMANVDEPVGSNGNWVFAIKDGSKLAGCIGLALTSPEKEAKKEPSDFTDPVPEGVTGQYGVLGYWIAVDYRKKGLASAALKKVIEILEAQVDLKTFVGWTFTENWGSRAVLEKNGFKYIKTVEKGAVKPYPREVKDTWLFILRK